MDAFSAESEMLSVWFHHSFTRFFVKGDIATTSKETSKILAWNTEYFKHIKIRGITFSTFWMESQVQPDFTNNFFTRVLRF